MISIKNLSKTYSDGFNALKDINLEIKKGEIFALLGPNGAGKTTLISMICGIAKVEEGEILVENLDIHKKYKEARKKIGLVPQELTTDAFENVFNTVSFTRGLFGYAPNPKFIEKILKDLSLWDKRNNQIRTLSGGMKRRVMIAKALSHEPEVLFLDEPSAGVDVELRKDMWGLVHKLRDQGVTIVLTTHYIEEAEEMADRVGVISSGELIVVEEKNALMQKMGTKKLSIYLKDKLVNIPVSLNEFELELDDLKLTYTYDSKKEENRILDIFRKLQEEEINFSDINTQQSSLEEIFVELVKGK